MMSSISCPRAVLLLDLEIDDRTALDHRMRLGGREIERTVGMAKLPQALRGLVLQLELRGELGVGRRRPAAVEPGTDAFVDQLRLVGDARRIDPGLRVVELAIAP